VFRRHRAAGTVTGVSSPARVGRPRRDGRAIEGNVREQVLAAASRLFATKGVVGTTMKELAGTAGLRTSSLYYYFDSKEAILHEIVAEVNRVFLEEVQRVDARVGSAASKLYRLICRDVELLCGLPYDLNEALNISMLQDEAFRWFWDDRESLYDAVETIVRAGVMAGEFIPVDTRLTAIAVLANDKGVRGWFGPVQATGQGRSRRASDSYEPNELGEFLADITVGGLLVDRDRLPEIRAEAGSD